VGGHRVGVVRRAERRGEIGASSLYLGLADVLWAGVVHDSELISNLERQSRVHPEHDSARYASMTHYVVLLKDGVVEIVAQKMTIERRDGSTVTAARTVIDQ
jgi:hypothetical protein